MVYLDSSYAIALASRSDRYHARAMELAAHIARHQVKIITTRAICLEIGDALSKIRFRAIAVDFLKSLEASPSVEIIPASDELYSAAFDLYKSRSDKEWGLTDCLSFIAMQRLNLFEALTCDEHFEQSGFKALLR